MHPQAQEFARLFEGWHKNYGTYQLTGEVDDNGKVRGQAKSIAAPVTLELWHDHLMGVQGLGIIPITDQSVVKFAAIDIDDYQLDVVSITKKIHEEGLPLVPCRTKSGGLHLYMFLADWSPAKVVQQKLRELAAILGQGDAEIFPKQHTILASRGDIGQWINMPYFKGENTDRYGLTESGSPIKIKDFPKVCFSRMLSPEDLVTKKYDKDEPTPLYEGPPCLNHLASKGFPMGTRNNGLFNLGLYAQKIDGDNWQTLLNKYNDQFMDPPLSPTEVSGVIKSLEKKKGYNYTCKSQPIVSFCNVNKCRACKYGVGVSGVGMPKFGTLCKMTTNPPIWFVDVEGGNRMELETEDLQMMRKFQIRCMEASSIMPPLLKSEVWGEIVMKLLQEVTIIEVSEESTPAGMLRLYLHEFLMARVSARSCDELLLGKPYQDPHRGLTFFRMRDWMDFLDRAKFKEFKMNRIAMYLKDWGAEKFFFNLKGHGTNCYGFPTDKLNGQMIEHDVPGEIKKPQAF